MTPAELLQSSPALFTGVVFLLGLLVGSFLNVVIHRLPRMLERDWRRQCADLATEDAEKATQAGAAGANASANASAKGAAKAAAAAKSQPSAKPPHTPRSQQDAKAEPPYNLVVPRSACPSCNAPIRAWQNIPLVSYALLRGKCASCGAHISWRYPIVELLTGILSATVAWHFSFGWAAAGALVLTWGLIALAAIDIDTQLLPDNLTLPLMWLGLLASLAYAGESQLAFPVHPRSSIIGAVAGYLSLWSVYHLFRLLTGKEGMGYGDFKLFAAFGAWFGWQMLPLIILMSAFTGAVVGIALIVLRRHGRDVPMPFGPYLAAAGWIALIWGPRLVDEYLRMSGLRGG